MRFSAAKGVGGSVGVGENGGGLYGAIDIPPRMVGKIVASFPLRRVVRTNGPSNAA